MARPTPRASEYYAVHDSVTGDDSGGRWIRGSTCFGEYKRKPPALRAEGLGQTAEGPLTP